MIRSLTTHPSDSEKKVLSRWVGGWIGVKKEHVREGQESMLLVHVQHPSLHWMEGNLAFA